MKLLVIVSALDLRLPYSCTPAWWQLLKALAEIDVEVIATPYAGRAVETPWWRAYENPCLVESESVRHSKRVLGPLARLGARTSREETGSPGEGLIDQATRTLASTWTRPRWERHIRRIIERERDVDAVLILTVPPNQIRGLARGVTERYGLPVYFYDGDVPASLPHHAGFRSGFRIYEGADLSEFEAVLSNSKDGAEDLLAMGARRVHTLYYGVDPTIFRPVNVEKDIDAFFYGHGAEYREQWVQAMLIEPSKALPGKRFALRGIGFEQMDLGAVEQLPYLSVGKLQEYCSRSKVNLLINRQGHAGTYGSSTSRPFELAAMRCCAVSSPYLGMEEWFEPGREVVMLSEPAEATERIAWLLDHPQTREEIAAAAYRRVLAEHTFRQRAQRLIEMLGLESPETATQRAGLVHT